MKRETEIDLATTLMICVALGLMLTGVWWSWPPAAVFMAGAVLLIIVGTFHHDRRKKQ